MAVSVAKSARRPEIVCAPGNAGTATVAENVDVAAEDIDGLLALVEERGVDLTLVGPEAPLCAGIVDRFEAAGRRVFGPNAKAARLEGDKTFCKKLLMESGVPTASGRCFDRYDHARQYLATRDTPQVVKAAGLAAGKGVVVCDDPADAILEAEAMMVEGRFGDAGRRIVVEEKLEGEELSVHAIVDGHSVYVLESSQDHKRVGDGDTGPNTGGMGAYSPAPIATDEVLREIESEILVPVLDALVRRDIHYRGVLYAGLMLTAGGPKVLEFNCRFGDPETQAMLPRMKTSLLDVAEACLDGRLDGLSLEWDPRPAVCVVMASGGYPGSYQRGITIGGLDAAAAIADAFVYHAGTTTLDGRVVTNGGRVLGVTALGDTIQAAQDRAYQAIDCIRFDGGFCRRDIGARALGVRPAKTVGPRVL